jgi:SAM-dependent methyltransferase
LFNYIGDISNIAHDIIKRYLKNFDAAVDTTLGNGHDTDFLSNNFKKVFSFDIQNSAVENYRVKARDNVILLNSSHENLRAFIDCKVDCIMYNLGFLPGGDKSITTVANSTLASLQEALTLLNPGGIISIAIYTGHEEGKREETMILDFVKVLSKRDYGVLLHSFANRINSPMLVIIEKMSNILRP